MVETKSSQGTSCLTRRVDTTLKGGHSPIPNVSDAKNQAYMGGGTLTILYGIYIAQYHVIFTQGGLFTSHCYVCMSVIELVVSALAVITVAV